MRARDIAVRERYAVRLNGDIVPAVVEKVSSGGVLVRCQAAVSPWAVPMLWVDCGHVLCPWREQERTQREVQAMALAVRLSRRGTMKLAEELVGRVADGSLHDDGFPAVLQALEVVAGASAPRA